MLTLAKRRREQERLRKLEEVFREADQNSSGKITKEQMINIFTTNELFVPNLAEEAAKMEAAGGGEIKWSDFYKFAMTTELCKTEFQDRVFQKVDLDDDKDKAKKKESRKKRLLRQHPDSGSKMDKVEMAFRKFDTNKDGFLSRDEFDQMLKDVSKEQADRIFRSCDKAGDGKISLEEFRRVLAKGKFGQQQKQ